MVPDAGLTPPANIFCTWTKPILNSWGSDPGGIYRHCIRLTTRYLIQEPIPSPSSLGLGFYKKQPFGPIVTCSGPHGLYLLLSVCVCAHRFFLLGGWVDGWGLSWETTLSLFYHSCHWILHPFVPLKLKSWPHWPANSWVLWSFWKEFHIMLLYIIYNILHHCLGSYYSIIAQLIKLPFVPRYKIKLPCEFISELKLILSLFFNLIMNRLTI